MFQMRETVRKQYAFHAQHALWVSRRLRLRLRGGGIHAGFSDKFDIDGHEYTQIQAINEMLRLLEEILKSDGFYDKKQAEMEHRVALIWAEVLPAMWW